MVGRIRLLLSSGRVTRWHHRGDLLHQNVGEHSWGVAAIVLALKPDASAALLRAAILHDAHEVAFGDIPSPTKERYPILKDIEAMAQREYLKSIGLPPLDDLTEEERRLLKVADLLDALFFVHRQTIEGRSALVSNIMRLLSGLIDKAVNGEEDHIT
jgi:5'-deoxynucleotidase YfbR-like HD superfamily hydrolase